MFKIGEAYTRRQIHEVLGGSVQSYLPTVQGRVVCACLTTKMNPGAPHVILVGNKPRVLQAAHQLVKQAELIPIFLKKASNAWVYAGNYALAKVTTKDEGLKRYDLAGRDSIELVLEMKENSR